MSKGDAAEKALRIQDCGDGSVQVLAAQARIPEFRFPAPLQVLDMVLHTCDPSILEMEAGDQSLGLAAS